MVGLPEEPHRCLPQRRTRLARPLERSKAGASEGEEQRGTIVGWQPGACRVGTSASARTYSDLVLTLIRLVTQPRAFVRPLLSLGALRLFALAGVEPPRKTTVMPRTACPASLTHAVTTAKVLFRCLWRRAVIVRRTGTRTKDVLCAELAALGVAVPGVYGTKTPFHG